MKPIHILTAYFFKFRYNIVLLSGLFHSDVPAKSLCAFLLYPMRAAFPAKLSVLDLITLILVISSNCETPPYYAVFSILIFLSLCYVQIFFLVPYSQIQLLGGGFVSILWTWFSGSFSHCSSHFYNNCAYYCFDISHSHFFSNISFIFMIHHSVPYERSEETHSCSFNSSYLIFH